MGTIIAVGVILVLLSIFGVSFSAINKATKMPKWAKFNPSKNWGKPGTKFYNFWLNKKWLKIIIIKLVQSVMITLLFFKNFLVITMKTFVKSTTK